MKKKICALTDTDAFYTCLGYALAFVAGAATIVFVDWVLKSVLVASFVERSMPY